MIEVDDLNMGLVEKSYKLTAVLTILCLKFIRGLPSPGVDLPADLKYESDGGRLDINIISLDDNIAKVCDRLTRLDTILTKMYQDPPEGAGDEIARLSRTYNQACLDLLYFCSLDKLKVLKAAEHIIELGGPKYFDVEVDENKMKERFNWDDDKMDGLNIIRKKTNEHWYDLWHLYKSLPE